MKKYFSFTPIKDPQFSKMMMRKLSTGTLAGRIPAGCLVNNTSVGASAAAQFKNGVKHLWRSTLSSQSSSSTTTATVSSLRGLNYSSVRGLADSTKRELGDKIQSPTDNYVATNTNDTSLPPSGLAINSAKVNSNGLVTVAFSDDKRTML